MNAERRNKLVANGWKFGGLEDFLGLTDEEIEYIGIKINIGELVREYRERKGLSQANAADLLKISQSHLAKVETANPTVTIDLQIRSALALGATRQEIGQQIAY